MLNRITLCGLLLIYDLSAGYAASSSVTSNLPFKHDSVDIGGQIQKTIIVFLLVILIAYFAIFFIKKYYNRKFTESKFGENQIKIIDRRYLARNLTVILLQINNTRYSLVQTHNELVLLEKATLVEENGKSEQTETSAG